MTQLRVSRQTQAHLMQNLAPAWCMGSAPTPCGAFSRCIFMRFPMSLCWSSLFLAVVISIRGEWTAIRPVLRSRRNVMLLSAGAVLIALNWLTFIYAVGSGQVLQASLGYFINPLLSIALGMIFLRERL